jgi:cytochrome c peroxidase
VFSWTGKYVSAGAVLNIAGPNAMNTKAEQAVITIRNNPDHLIAYERLFGASPQVCTLNPRGAELESTYTCEPCEAPNCHTAGVVFQNIADVFDAYLRTLNSSESPFDKYIRSAYVDGKTTLLVEGFGDRERRGLAVFIGKGMCIDCHRGPLLSDLTFHNTSVPQTGPNVNPMDGGLGAEMFSSEQRLGEFLTPSLRHVAKTAPYMHAGQFDSLAEVIEFYRRGGSAEGFAGIKDGRIQPLEITDDEARDLEAFLISLTGTDEQAGAWAPPP